MLVDLMSLVLSAEWVKECSMNYVVPACFLRNLKLIGMRVNSFCNLLRSKSFTCQEFIVRSINLKNSSINQKLIVNIELSSYFNMYGTSFVIDIFEDVMHVFARCSHSIEPFFCTGRVEFIVVIEVCGMLVKSIGTSVRGECAWSSGSGVVGKLYEG